MNTTGTIYYGFGREYLPAWNVQHAIREIYQNFLDFGDYDEEVTEDGLMVTVKLINGWQPENLEYLRIGNSHKENINAIGHHGEGLKMAFLILQREGFKSSIFTNKYSVYPSFQFDQEIGEVFCFEYEIHDMYESPYTLEFECMKADFDWFKDNLITDADIEFSEETYGDIVNKPKGNLYSGRLFVKHIPGLSRAYNVKPRHLPLDRDRCMPGGFDVNWSTSRILEASEKFSARDLTYSDTQYIQRFSTDVLSDIKPRRVGNSIEFTFKDENNKDTVISNDSVKEKLMNEGFFSAILTRLKKAMGKDSSLRDLLVAFGKKHVHGTAAKQDFEIILARVKK